MYRKSHFSIHDADLMYRKVPFPIHEISIMYRIYGIMKQQKKGLLDDLRGLCGAEDDLNEPFVRLLMLVRAVNKEIF